MLLFSRPGRIALGLLFGIGAAGCGAPGESGPGSDGAGAAGGSDAAASRPGLAGAAGKGGAAAKGGAAGAGHGGTGGASGKGHAAYGGGGGPGGASRAGGGGKSAAGGAGGTSAGGEAGSGAAGAGQGGAPGASGSGGASGSAGGGAAGGAGAGGSNACLPAFGDFQAGSWPPACWRPYADDSPLNRRVPPAPKLLPRSAELVSNLVSVFGTPHVMQVIDDAVAPQDDYGHPTYYARPGDPTFTVHCSTGWCPTIEGMTVPIPAQAMSAQGTDHHMTVVDQATGFEWDFWEAPDPAKRTQPGSTLNFGGGGREKVLNGTGIDSGATAAGFATLAGQIRAQEWAAGEINHALFGAGFCCEKGNPVWPAMQCDRPCSDHGVADKDAPRMGMRMYLDYSDAEIDALQLPAWQKPIIVALAHYGVYWGDSGGDGPNWGAAGVESGQTYLSYGVPDPAVEFVKKNGFALVGNSQYRLDYSAGVDWTRLKVIDPCVTQGTCL